MFCPECGEVIGSDPLDVRRARCVRRRSVVGFIHLWIGKVIGRLSSCSRRRVGGPRGNEEV